MDFIIWILIIVAVSVIGLRILDKDKFNQLKEFIKNKYMR
jgi:preprotein translocase subunit SecG|tara:strand:+ start:174 stop:293 length:120 start_codon:yes stop_codon:yes gene_type:complete